MDWRRVPSNDPADPHGVAGLLTRACEHVSATAVDGTRFLFTTSEMQRVSREIEQESMVYATDEMFVGVQLAHRLELQADVYAALDRAGVGVTAFGCDDAELHYASWVRVPDDPFSVAGSWFLVRGGSRPHALVGFELDDERGGQRCWEGFETRDARLIDGLLSHLRALVDERASASGR